MYCIHVICIAWGKGFRQIELECVNVLLVEFVLVRWYADSSLVELHLIYQLLIRNWKVKICHILKSLNEMADHMTKCTVNGLSLLQ